MPSSSPSPVYIEACDCRTPLGSARESCDRLLAGEVALRPSAVPFLDGAPPLPLATFGEIEPTLPPRWLAPCRELVARMPGYPWGTARHPAVITSSNFGIDHMLALHTGGESGHAQFANPARSAEAVASACGIGPNRSIISNACVSAQLGLAHGQRLLENDLADAVLLLSFDFLSPFVAGGFYSLRILNGELPQPYSRRDTGAIGLGEGVAAAVISRQKGAFRLAASATGAESHHMTGNDPSGSGFRNIARAVEGAAKGRRLWLKGHGTGTLDAGRLEAEEFGKIFPASPLVSWKGSLGHTLGSCGLVEMAIALAAEEVGQAPGTVGSAPPYFSENVAGDNFPLDSFDGVALFSSAFGGVHAANLLLHD